jgi:nicotinate-nucleotide adenylyltransferase
MDRGQPSVTADTLEALARPGRSLYLLLGADAVSNMPTWRRLDETRNLATIVVIERDGEHAVPPGDGWIVEHLTIPRLDVSSTAIRQRLERGFPIDGLVPEPAVRVIRTRGLYAAGR